MTDKDTPVQLFTKRMYDTVSFLGDGAIEFTSGVENVISDEGEYVILYATPPYSKHEMCFHCEVVKVEYHGDIWNLKVIVKDIND